MQQLSPAIQELVDSIEDNSMLLIYVKKLICNQDIEFESIIKHKIALHEKKFYFYNICYSQGQIPFPEPHVNRVYFFLPKAKHFSLVAEAKHVAADFDRIVQVVGKTADEVAHLYPEHVQPPQRNITPEVEQQQTEMLNLEDISKFPSGFQMARNLLKSGWQVAKGVASGRQIMVHAEEAARRYSICETCPKLVEKRCTACGCFMEHKTQLAIATCPDNKW